MESVDVPLLAIWSVSGLSLVLQIYLFVTWPRGDKGSVDAATSLWGGATLPPAGGSSELVASRGGSPLWEVPPEVVMDNIFAQTPPLTSDPATSRRPVKRRDGKVTLKQRIVRAGIYRKSGMRRFHVVRVLLTLTFFGVGCFAMSLSPLPMTYTLYGGAAASLAGYLLPSFWLDQRLRQRQVTMRRALPDALDLVTVCIQGGLSLPAAMARVARELGPAHPLLARELSIVEREIQMGRSTGEAMLQFAQRFHLEELRSLSSVVGQTEKYGGSIAGALKTYAEGLRTKRRQRAEEMAKKAAVKLLFPTIICIFPGIFVVVLGPTAVRMYQVMAEVSWGG